MKAKVKQFWQQQEGVVAPLFAILLVFGIIVGILALVLDLGHMHNVRSELQKAADACALRGARAFLPDQIPFHSAEIPPDPFRAEAQAIDTITRNISSFQQLTDLPGNDVLVGIWDFSTSTWYQGQVWDDPRNFVWNAEDLFGKDVGPGVGLITRREGNLNQGPVPMTVGKIPPVSINSMPANALAIAALSPVGGFPEGYGEFPMALREKFVLDNLNKPVYVDLNVDPEDKGGWTNLKPDKNVGDWPRKYLGDKNSRPVKTPEVRGTEIGLKNGTDCAAIKALYEQYGKEWDRFGLVETGKKTDVYRPVTIKQYLFPVVPTDKLNQTSVWGAVLAELLEVRGESAEDDPSTIEEEPKCAIKIRIVGTPSAAGGTYGGGRYYGVLSTEPKLVQ